MGCNYQRLIGINGRVICRISIVNQISYETGFFRTILRESTEESIKLLHNIDPFNRTANVGESHHRWRKPCDIIKFIQQNFALKTMDRKCVKCLNFTGNGSKIDTYNYNQKETAETYWWAKTAWKVCNSRQTYRGNFA